MYGAACDAPAEIEWGYPGRGSNTAIRLLSSTPSPGTVTADPYMRPSVCVMEAALPSRSTTHTWVVWVCSVAAGDNAFVKVAAIHTDDFVTGFTPNCMSNTDGVGQPEYVWSIDHQIRAYHGAAPGQWTLSTSANDPDATGMHTAIAAYDINQNGRDEIYWATQGNAIYGNTLVLERPPPSPADTDTWAPLGAVTARVRPTPCRAHATLRLADPKLQRAAFSIAAYDVSGRLVLRERMRFSSSSDIDVPIRALRPGWYVLRVEDRVGQPVAIARTVIVR